jgi:hypothetical protein
MRKHLLVEIGLAVLVVFSFFAPNVWQSSGQAAEAGGFTVSALQSEAPQTAPTTAFTYQGELKKAGVPYDGVCTFDFRLFTTLTGATQLGSTQIIPGVAVTGGLFTTVIDFGDQFNGQENFLQTGVFCTGDVGLTSLTPRTALKPAPYSISTSALRGRTVSDSAPATGDFLAWDGSQWAPSAAQARRKYYLTIANVDGANALNACSAGYHMASLAEIFDTSNLQYNTALGFTAPDSGGGPPFSTSGWVRTGVSSNINSTPGNANCAVWTSNSASANGTLTGLNPVWTTSSFNVISPWGPGISTCNLTNHVWCVED